jgi:alpha-galactosidase
VRSHFCPAFALCADVRKDGTDWDQFRRLVLDWKAISDDFLGDYYPLTPYSLDAGAWIAWQFHRPETGTGFVQVFRRTESVFEAARFRLRGLDPKLRYRVVERDVPGAVERSGRELAENGLPVAIVQQPGAVIFTYSVVK